MKCIFLFLADFVSMAHRPAEHGQSLRLMKSLNNIEKILAIGIGKRPSSQASRRRSHP
jgi:hypothetical protein